MNHHAHKVDIKLERPGAKLPSYVNEAAAADVYACIDEPVVIKPGETKIIPLGFSMVVPEGCFLAVVPRSGISAKTGIRVSNSPGVVDPDYRGEVGVIVTNTKYVNEDMCGLCASRECEQCEYSTKDRVYAYESDNFVVNPGDRICQVMLLPVYRMIFDVKDELPETKRGSGGFGSTGVN